MKTTKKILSVILTLAMLLTSFVFVFPAAAEVTFGGSGTQADPYTIGTVDQFKLLRDNVNAESGATTYAGTYFKLTADIDLTEGGTVDVWVPIGDTASSTHRFNGVLDGNGKTITMKQTAACGGGFGLFGWLAGGAIVKNLTLNADIQVDTGTDSLQPSLGNLPNNGGTTTAVKVGGTLAAIMASSTTLDHVTVNLGTSKVTTNNSSLTYVGGLVGAMRGTSDWKDGKITATDNPTIKYCTVNGSLTVDSKSSIPVAGGIVAAVGEQGAILNTKNNANISIISYGKNSMVGGIIGNIGDMDRKDAENYFKVINCVNTGALSASGGNNSRVGGILGDPYRSLGNLLIEQCGSYGKLSSLCTGTGQLGLFVGYDEGVGVKIIINQCYFNQTALNQSKRSSAGTEETFVPGIHGNDMGTKASGTITRPATASGTGDKATGYKTSVYTVVSVGTNVVDTTLNTNNYWDDYASSELTAATDYNTEHDTDFDYVIASAADLALMAKLCNETGVGSPYPAYKYVLVNDIDLSAHQWTPIATHHATYGTRANEGNYSLYFTGTFDGNGHTISGLTMTNEAYTYGQSLFGVINTGAVIKNFTLDGARVDKASQATNTKASVNGGVGLIANIAYAGTISNVNVTNMNVNADLLASNTGGYIGGFVAYVGNATVNIVDCTASGSINVRTDKTAFVGGIAARINGVNINRCTSNVNITFKTTINPYSYVGGIVGVVDTTTDGRKNDISNSIYEGALTLADGSTGALGLAGILGGTVANTGYTVTITNCASIQTYTGKTLGNLGGIVGANRNTASGDKKTSIISCYTNSAKLGTNLNITDSNLTITNSVAGTFDLETLKGAAIRLDASDLNNSGIRFDSNVNETTIAALKNAGFTVELGTVIAPTEFFQHFDGDAAALVANGTDGSNKESGSYVKVVYSSAFRDDEEANFNGALKTIKSENYDLNFNGAAYVTITKGDLTYTAYADVNFGEGTDANPTGRSVKWVANAALADKTHTYNEAEREILTAYAGEQQ